MQSVLIKLLALKLCIFLSGSIYAKPFNFSKELNQVVKTMKQNKFTKNTGLLGAFVNKVEDKVKNEKKISKDYNLASELLVELNYYGIDFYDFDKKFCKKLLIRTKRHEAYILNKILNSVCASK